MTLPQQFSSGLVQAPFVASSGLLLNTWGVISSPVEAIVGSRALSWKLYQEPASDLTVLAFQVEPDFHLEPGLVSFSELRGKNFRRFEFLCNKKILDFKVNASAVSLLSENIERLDELKSEINDSPRLIVTGHGLGGPIASLFTLLLLDSPGLGKKHPLCITFGSPLVGDKSFQEAISRSSTWSSCFLHVVSYKDPQPKKLKPGTDDYMPFGTFLFCSDTNSTCFENPLSVLELLVVSIGHQNQGFQPIDYGNIVENLYRKAICKDFTPRMQDLNTSNSLRASICLQLWAALGLFDVQQQQQNIDNNTLATKMETLDISQLQHNIDVNTLVTKMQKLEEKFIFQKKIKFDPSRKLNVMKRDMAQLEWYKKDSKNRDIGYYDSYKRSVSTSDQDAVKFQKNLTNYWKDMVEEAEMKPQREGAAFRIRWLYAGTNYRRMVEPLDIAEYYANGGKDYITNQRSKHYKVLEEWVKEGRRRDSGDSNRTNRTNVELILTFDSCFWAHVEEALLLCKELKSVQSSLKEKEEATRKLVDFEEYVYGLLMKFEVSPEIFLTESSYMTWWNQYKAIKGISYNSALAGFMSNPRHYVQYTEGTYVFPEVQ
ncbi:senescence-associated carboxylesterase 101 isoform X2 [Cajanus cajan]|uniref:senescence-associated carboxylesterase 101 isoform X2 n=1 Tax=Cajanus cajan TaxID=3821 RepID=UPI00098DA496|nr:senescence-associated carboxylesterase 101 isoform X2 [Cajanus cajan]